MTDTTPGFDQVVSLPAVSEGTVTPDFIDLNGHMNILHYLDYLAWGADTICSNAGIDVEYRHERRMGVFAAEHHLNYYRELREGEKFSVHVRPIERSDKALHLVAMLLDRTNDRLACTLETILVHVDMDSRRATPIPADIAAGLDREFAAYAGVDWPVPLCGAMRLRH
jgi:acyl-CoA thioester hydrolase